MLNSTKHEIILLIDVKISTIIGILTFISRINTPVESFISRINTISKSFKARFFFYFSSFYLLWATEISCSVELNMKKDLQPRDLIQVGLTSSRDINEMRG